jgi:tRNA-Thr(GGU) m(6)t(6)A37 methyltransferase TsaA
MKEIIYKPIGTLHTPFKERLGTPRQAVGSSAVGTVEIFREFGEGLKDLDQYSHLLVMFHMHKIEAPQLLVQPPWSEQQRGVFSSVAPHRPNPIGISVVELVSVKYQTLTIRGVDMVDGTPVLDIKPYLPALFPRENVRLGWYEGHIEEMLNSFAGEK